MSNNQYTLRQATEADERTFARLAELDSRSRPALPALIAEVDDRAVAAMSLADGSVVADPFVGTAEAVELLRTRSRMLAEDVRSRHGGVAARLAGAFGLLARQH